MSGLINTIRTTVAENLGGKIAQAAAPVSGRFEISQIPDQSGKVAVVTGGSEGIGFGCSHTLLSKNISKLYILSVEKTVIADAKAAVGKELGQDKADKIEWIQCDLSDWKRVAEVSKEISSSTDRLDILINNAARGIMTYQLTDYGVDRHMAVNHMGHTILTSHLLPLMKQTASKGNTVRIVNLASNAHEQVPKDLKFNSLSDLNQDMGPMAQYGRTKLCSILYARYLTRHLNKEHPNILANASHPGIVSTRQSTQDIHEPYPLLGYGMSVGFEPFKKDQFEGALSTLFAATTTKESGQYVCPPAIIEPGSELSQDEELGEQLMTLTRKVVSDITRADSVDKGCPMKDY